MLKNVETKIEELYLTDKFKDMYQDMSFNAKQACLGMVYTYLGRNPEGSQKGLKSEKLRDLEVRASKGGEMFKKFYSDPNMPMETKTAAHNIWETFNDYAQNKGERIKEKREEIVAERKLKREQRNYERKEEMRSCSLTTKIEEWQAKYSQWIVRDLHELNMAYQGRDTITRKRLLKNSYDERYKKANEVISKMISKYMPDEKRKAIRELSQVFSEYEGNREVRSQEIRDALRARNAELLSTIDWAVERYKRKKEEMVNELLEKQRYESTLIGNIVCAAKASWEKILKVITKPKSV